MKNILWIILCLILVILVGSLSGCSSTKRAQKYWGKVQEELKKHPEIADSLKLTKTDTFKTETIKDSIREVKVADQKKVDSLASELLKANANKPAITEAIAQEICPDVKKEATYYINVYNSEFSFKIPVTVKIWAKGGKLDYSINVHDINVPESRVITEIQFKSEPVKFYKNNWFWVSVGLFALLALIVIALILRR